MTEPRVEFSIERGIGIARLNRPEVRNAIDDDTRTELEQILGRVASDSDIKGFVLTGNGTAFCAGGDVSAMRDRLAAAPGQLAVSGCSPQ